MKRVLVSLVIAVCSIGLVSGFLAPAASAAPWRPTDGVIFNNPKGSHASEYAIIRQLDRTISRVPRGQLIRMAMYLFDRPSTAKALIAAHHRGVNVQIILDDGAGSSSARKLRREINKKGKGYGQSFVVSCFRACMSNVAGSVLHSKFYIFSAVQYGPGKFVRNVSMVSSANPHKVNTIASWNNIHTIANNKAIFNSLSGYFKDMLKDKQQHNYYDTRKPVVSGKYKLSYYPRAAKRGVETVEFLDALKRVNCRAGGGYGDRGRTVIRVAMWGWTNPLIAVAKRLTLLKRQGCRVDVIMNQGRSSTTIIRELIRKDLPTGQIPVYNGWKDKNRNDVGELYVHHKAMIINGRYNGKNRKVIFTGSQNLTSTGIRINDDQILQVTDNRMYDAYSRNFSYIAGKYAPRMRKMPKRIILKSSPHASRDRAKFGNSGNVDPSDGLSANEKRILDAEQDAVTEAGVEG